MWSASLSPDLSSWVHLSNIDRASGGMAQLVARLHGMEKVRGSNPLTSTARRTRSHKHEAGSFFVCTGSFFVCVGLRMISG